MVWVKYVWFELCDVVFDVFDFDVDEVFIMVYVEIIFGLQVQCEQLCVELVWID